MTDVAKNSWTTIASATSGKFTIRWQMYYSEQDIANNRTYVYRRLLLTVGAYGSAAGYGYMYGATGIETSENKSGYFSYSAGASSADFVLVSNSGWVTHNNDGTYSVTGSGQLRWGWDGSNWVTLILGTSAGTAKLPDIPRASVPTLSATSVEIGNKVTLNTNRASSSFTHEVSMKIGSANAVTLGTSVGASIEVNTATYVATAVAQMSNKKATAVFTVVTKNGSNTIGTKTVSMTITLTPSVPTLSATTMNIGDTLTVTTNRLNTTSARTHGLFVRYGSDLTARWIAQSGITTSQAYNSSGADHVGWIMAAAGNATSISATFVLQTIVNNEPIGSSTVSATIKINPSVPTFNGGITSFTIGNTIQVNTNRANSSRTHKVEWLMGTTAISTTGTSVGASSSLNTSTATISNAIMDKIGSSASSGTLSAKVTTYISGVAIGNKTISLAANVNTSTHKPTITFGTLTDAGSFSAYHAAGEMINILSDLRMTISFGVTNTHGMALASASITIGNNVIPRTLSGTSATYALEQDGIQTNKVTVTVKDARGTTVTAEKTWTLVGYQRPTILTKTVNRISSTGTDAQFSLTGTAYAGTYSGSSSATNSLTITYKVTPVGGTRVNGQQTYTVSLSGSGSKNWPLTRTFVEQFANESQYDIEFTIADAFSSIQTGKLRIYNGLPVWGWGKESFDVYGDIKIHKRTDDSSRWIMPDTFNAILANDGRKNLLPTPQSGDTVNNGITYSVKGNGRVAATGTATANASFIISLTWTEPTGNYFFSGIETGSASTGYVFVWDNATSARAKKWDRSTNVESGVSSSKAYEVYLVNGQEYSFYYRIQEGATVSNLSWYPMVWDGRIASTDYVQYSPPGQSASTTGTNIDNLVAPGAYTVTNPTGTLPITTSYAQIYVLDSAYSWVPQIGVFNGNVYYRYKSNNSSAWDPWKRLSRERGTLASGNLNDVEVNTVYYLTTANTYTNAPSTAGILETIASTGTTGIKSQTLRNGASFYYRYGNSNGWGSWYKVTATAV